MFRELYVNLVISIILFTLSMAARYLHSLADENADLQQQIGCVTGIFQIFNRHHIVSRSRVFSRSPKRRDHYSLLFHNGTFQSSSSVMGQRHMTGEKHCVSSKDSSASRLMNRQNLDLRDVVKDSMYREARGLSHNAVMKTGSNNWYGDEPRQLSRSNHCQSRHRIESSVCKIYPRFSYDGLETDSKTTNHPMLFLGSKEWSLSLEPIKPSNKKVNHSTNLKINGRVGDDKDLSRTKSPGVVAKLMGLETLKQWSECNSSSRVCVLDDSIYVDNSPSLVKHTTITKEDDADRYEATTDGQSNTIPRVSFQTNCEKPKKVEDLVPKHKNLNSIHINDGDDLKWKDVLEKAGNWKGFCSESPVIAMEVERLILTDLVNEVVIDS